MGANLFPQDIQAAAVYAAESVSTAAIDRYVATTGSDVTGDGSAGNPYATPARAYLDMPRRLLHRGKILIAAGTYVGGWPRTIDTEFAEDGALTFCGVGTPAVVRGPYTISSVADRGDCGQTATLGSSPWTVDQNVGFFLLVTSGARQGMCYRIFHNTANTITVHLSPIDPLQGGDTFTIVKPAVTVEFQTGEGCTLDYRALTGTNWGTGYEGGDGRLSLHNLTLTMAAPSAAEAQHLVFKGHTGASGYFLDFVRIEVPTGAPYEFNYVVLDDTIVNNNYSPPVDLDYVTDGGTGIVNLCSAALGSDVGVSISDGGNPTQRDLHVFGLSSLAVAFVEGAAYCDGGGASLEATRAAFGGVLCYGGRFWGTYCYYVGVAGEDTLIAYSSTIQLTSGYFYRGRNAILSRTNSHFWVEVLACDSSLITASAMYLGACVTVHHEGSLATFKGASATGAKAYCMYAPAVDVKSDNWPADGAGVNDGMGSFIARND